MIRLDLTSFITIVLLLILSGCSSFPEGRLDLSVQQRKALWQEHESKLSKIHHWEIKGRLGLKTSQRFGSASIYWGQQGEHYNVVLDGPFGLSVASITGGPDKVIVQISDQQHVDTSPEDLIRNLTGWVFPVSYLKYWIRGLPALDRSADIDLNNLGYPKTIHQHGWDVAYQQYQEVGDLKLPSKMTVSSSSMRLTLIIIDWHNLSNN